jgi:hypothetical protein
MSWIPKTTASQFVRVIESPSKCQDGVTPIGVIASELVPRHHVDHVSRLMIFTLGMDRARRQQAAEVAEVARQILDVARSAGESHGSYDSIRLKVIVSAA